MGAALGPCLGVVAGVGLIFLAFSLESLRDSFRLSSKGTITDGIVTATDLESHEVDSSNGPTETTYTYYCKYKFIAVIWQLADSKKAQKVGVGSATPYVVHSNKQEISERLYHQISEGSFIKIKYLKQDLKMYFPDQSVRENLSSNCTTAIVILFPISLILTGLLVPYFVQDLDSMLIAVYVMAGLFVLTILIGLIYERCVNEETFDKEFSKVSALAKDIERRAPGIASWREDFEKSGLDFRKYLGDGYKDDKDVKYSSSLPKSVEPKKKKLDTTKPQLVKDNSYQPNEIQVVSMPANPM